MFNFGTIPEVAHELRLKISLKNVNELPNDDNMMNRFQGDVSKHPGEFKFHISPFPARTTNDEEHNFIKGQSYRSLCLIFVFFF